MQGVEQSLKRLQVDAIDLYQSHWDDEATPLDETLEAYSRLLQQGKVKVIGAVQPYRGSACARHWM
jgi:aryl-alcohol dehydrogenase-like predicted oxidoreductase